jgi:hypothetical protein
MLVGRRGVWSGSLIPSYSMLHDRDIKVKFAKLVAAVTIPGTKIANTDKLETDMQVKRVQVSMKLTSAGLQVESSNIKVLIPTSHIAYMVLDES